MPFATTLRISCNKTWE